MSKKTDNENIDIGSSYIDKIVVYIQKNRMQTFYNLILLTIIMIQTPFMIQALDGVTVKIELPPKGTVVIGNNKGNKLYYQLWAEHYTNNKEYTSLNYKSVDKNNSKENFPFTYSIVDFDYTNVEEKYKNFLKNYEPSILIKERHIFNRFIKNIKIKMISQEFLVTNINTELFKNGSEATSTITGVAKQKIGKKELEPKECKYSLNFKRQGGNIYATAINTNCF